MEEEGGGGKSGNLTHANVLRSLVSSYCGEAAYHVTTPIASSQAEVGFGGGMGLNP